MSPEQFDYLLAMVVSSISKKDTWKISSAAERLALNLRFFSAGDAQQSLFFSYRLSKCLVRNIISETCEAVYPCLKKGYFNLPETQSSGKKLQTRQIAKLGNVSVPRFDCFLSDIFPKVQFIFKVNLNLSFLHIKFSLCLVFVLLYF